MIELSLNSIRTWRKTTIFCLFCLFSGCGGEAHKKAKIRQAVQDELKRYPEARLVDLYKFFFQGAFGPGHLINDANAASRFLQIELQQAEQFSALDWHAVGYDALFYRINLRLVHDGAIPFRDYLEAFLQSAATFDEPEPEAWRKEWHTIAKIISEMPLQMNGFRADSSWLEQQIEAGHLVVHHSEIFEERYHPHYRIIDREHFEQLFQRFLKSGQNRYKEE